MSIAHFIAAAAAMALSATAAAQSRHGSKEDQADARRHRVMAVAHEAAARCYEAGKGEKACLEQLRKDCKGVGIGRYCGMKHQH
jgi:hypothetical protein